MGATVQTIIERNCQNEAGSSGGSEGGKKSSLGFLISK